MVYHLDLHPEALEELDEAITWYLEQSSDLGQSFFDEFLAARTRVLIAPLQFPVVFQDFRSAVFDRFPYSILFAVDGQQIVIYAVFHHKRNPAKWKART